MDSVSINKKLNIGMEPKMYIISAFLGVVLLFYNIWEIKPVTVDKDSFGLASYLTVSYWIGYILMIICSIVLYYDNKTKSDSIYLIYLVVIGLFLFGVPIFAEENARFAYSYYPTGDVRTVLDTQKIDKISEYPPIAYRSWPGTHLISIFTIYLTDISLDDLIKYMPTFWVLALILITYCTGKILKLPGNQCFSVSLLTLSAFWTAGYYYGPQSIVYIIYLLFFVSTILLYRRDITPANIMFTILVFSATVVTHLLTSMALIIIFLFSSGFIISWLKPVVPVTIKGPIKETYFIYKNRSKIIILFVVIFIGWHIYNASTMFNVGIRDLTEQIIEGQVFNVFQTEKYNSGTTLIRQIIHYSRMMYPVIFAISIMTAIMLYLKGKITENRQVFEICLLWLIGLSTLLVFRYGAEMDDRVYIFSLLPATIIIIIAFDRKIVTILILLLIVLHIPAHYGTESYDMIRTTELQGSKFIALNIGPYDSINYYYGTLMKYHNPQLVLSNRPGMGYKKGFYDPDEESLESSIYVIDSKQMSNYLLYIYGIDKIQIWLQKGSSKLNLMYDNGYYSIYKKIDIKK